MTQEDSFRFVGLLSRLIKNEVYALGCIDNKEKSGYNEVICYCKSEIIKIINTEDDIVKIAEQELSL